MLFSKATPGILVVQSRKTVRRSSYLWCFAGHLPPTLLSYSLSNRVPMNRRRTRTGRHKTLVGRGRRVGVSRLHLSRLGRPQRTDWDAEPQSADRVPVRSRPVRSRPVRPTPPEPQFTTLASLADRFRALRPKQRRRWLFSPARTAPGRRFTRRSPEEFGA